MEISHLKVFQAVAERGSVSEAARHLNCVQSNVTARIKNLENELGSVLFYRKPRGMVTTPAGRLLLTYARKIIHLEKEAKKALLTDDKIQGQLLLGTFESVAAVRFPVLLARYHRLYPGVDLSLITESNTALCRKVIDYEIDGAFVSDDYKLPGLEWTQAFFENLVLVCPAGKEPLETAVKKGVLVFPKPCAYRERLEQWFRNNHLALNQKMELGTVDGILKCVAAGMGMAALPLSTVEKALALKTVSIHPIGTSLEAVPIMFVKRNDTLISKPLEAFLELLANPEAERTAKSQGGLELEANQRTLSSSSLIRSR